MFGDGAAGAQVGQLGAGIAQLGVGPAQIKAAGDAARKAVADQPVGAGVGFDRAFEQADQPVITAQFEVGARQLGLQRQPRGGKVVVRRHAARARCSDRGPHPAPQVQLVAGHPRKRIGGIEIGLVVAAQGPVVRLTVGQRAAPKVDLRHHPGARLGQSRRRRLVPGQRLRQRRIIAIEPGFEIGQRRVGKAAPPRPRFDSGRARRGPWASAIKPRRSCHHRRAIVWRHSAAAQRRGQQQPCAKGPSDAHRPP